MTQFAQASLVIRAINKTQKTFAEINDSVGKMERRFNRLSNFVTRKFIPAFLAIKSVTLGGRLADEFTDIENKLRVVSNSSDELKSSFVGVTEVARITQSSIAGTANLYSRLVVATKDLSLSQKEQLKITQAVNQTFRISGATTQETAAASIQLAQGLASGRLAGDELRSVLENNVVLGQLLAKSFNTNVGTLRDLAAEGKITADVVADILLKNFDDLNEKAGKIAPTFSRAGQVLRDQFGIGFMSQLKETFSEMSSGLTENSEGFRKFGELVGRTLNFIINLFGEFGSAILYVGQVFEPVFKKLGDLQVSYMKPVEDSITQFKVGFKALIAAGLKFANNFMAVFEGISRGFSAFVDNMYNRFFAFGRDLANFINDPLSGIDFSNTKAALEVGLGGAIREGFNSALEEAKRLNKAIDAEVAAAANKALNIQSGGFTDDPNKKSGEKSGLEKTNEQTKLFNKLQREAQRIVEATRTPLEAYNIEMERLNLLLKEGHINQETFSRASEQALERFENASKKTRGFVESEFDSLGNSIQNRFINSLDVTTGKFESFRDVAKDILGDISNSLLKLAFSGGQGGGGFGGIVGAIGSFFGGGGGASFGTSAFADGGIMTSRGAIPLRKYSKGGVANSPQMALFGEGRKAEAYVPLPDGRTIPVTMDRATGGKNEVHNHYNIDARGADAGVEQRVMNAIQRLSKSIEPRAVAAFKDTQTRTINFA